MKSSKDSDAISVTASEEEVQNLLNGVSRGSSHKNDNNEGAKDHDGILKELTATFQDEDKKGPPINKQLAEMANKRWGKKLEQEKMSSLLTKYDPPGKLCGYNSDSCQFRNLAVTKLLQEESQPLARQFATGFPEGNVCNPNECR